MTVKRRLIAGLATCLLSMGAGALVAAPPAQAAVGPCPLLNAKFFCLYRSAVGFHDFSEGLSGNYDRNICIELSAFDANSVWNATGTRWFLFHTTTCNGSHAEIAPSYTGHLPAGYDNGSTHAVMRTSTTS
jgi:hypothetical protein